MSIDIPDRIKQLYSRGAIDAGDGSRIQSQAAYVEYQAALIEWILELIEALQTKVDAEIRVLELIEALQTKVDAEIDRAKDAETKISTRLSATETDILNVSDELIEASRDPTELDAANNRWRFWFTKLEKSTEIEFKIWARLYPENEIFQIFGKTIPKPTTLVTTTPAPQNATVDSATGVVSNNNFPNGTSIRYLRTVNQENRYWFEVNDPNNKIVTIQYRTFVNDTEENNNFLLRPQGNPFVLLIPGAPSESPSVTSIRIDFRWVPELNQANSVYTFSPQP